jgi:cytochrome c peroxidase
MTAVRVRLLSVPALAASSGLLAAAGLAFANTGDPFQPVAAPADNPQTAAKISLGKELFWDVRMSTNDTVACGSCHTPEAGGSHPLSLNVASKNPGADGIFGTQDDVFGSIGVWGQTTGRNAPNFINTQFQAHQFWDRRAGPDFFSTTNPGQLLVRNGSLESQAVGPPRSPVEMGFLNRTPAMIEAKFQPLSGEISGTPYTQLFATAFGDGVASPASVTFDRMGQAIAAYERSLMTDQSPFHVMAATANAAAMTPQQNNGWDVFRGAGRCDKCHLRGENFSDGQVHNIGVTPIAEDLGTFNTTGRVRHKGAFKTGVLNNLSANAPYFHGGQMMTIEELIDFYDRGGDNHVQQDPLIRPLGLSATQKADLAVFLRTGITDSRAINGLAPFDHPNVASAVSSFTDVTNPTVSLVSPNLANTLQGTIKFVATASDDQNVKKVSFKLDGGAAVDDGSAPYTRIVGPLSNAGHTIEVIATDVSGNTATTGPLNFSVDSSASDLTPPDVAFTSPNGKTPVGGAAVKVAVDAFDNLGVTRVDYSVDGGGVLASSSTGPSFATTLNLSTLDGLHTLKAVAFDAANNASPVATLDVTVTNALGFPKSILPIAGDGVAGLGAITFTGSFTATTGSVRVVATGLPVPLNPTGRFTVVLSSPLSDITLGTARPNVLGNFTTTFRTPRGDLRNRVFWADTLDILDGTNLVGQAIVSAGLASRGTAAVAGRIGALRITFRTILETTTVGPNEGDITGTVDALRVPAGSYLARFSGPAGSFDVPFSPDAAGVVAAKRVFPREMLSVSLQFNNVTIFQNGVQIGTARIVVR